MRRLEACLQALQVWWFLTIALTVALSTGQAFEVSGFVVVPGDTLSSGTEIVVSR